jgi:hypothetical protein
MFSRLMRWWAVTGLLAVAPALLLSAGQAQAQCRGGQQQGRSGPLSMPRPGMPAFGMQQSPLQQLGTLVTLQQQQQQMAMLLALQQQQNARLVAQQPQQQPPQQNAVLNAQPQPQQQQKAPAAQAHPVPMPAADAPAPKPENPDEAAARQLKMARELLADARTADLNGEANRATRMRARATDRLKNLIATYPGTKAAEGAQDLLDELGR